MLPPHQPGTILRDRYRLIEIVGAGGMGCIYRSEDLRLPGRLCAIKEIQPEEHLSAEDRTQLHDQFHTEASILARLDHPYLPKVSDFFTDNNREYLVMDFVPGDDLKEQIDAQLQNDSLLPVKTVMTWAEQLIDALKYLHAYEPPVVHRDIKPANIKVTPNGRIKLVDFGLVKLMVPDDQRTLTVMQGRGSALYTPLEQYGGDGGHTDVRSDIYSFGATLYHLLTGKAPPDAKARFLNPRALRPVSELNPAVSKSVGDAVLWAMAMHPDDRPNSIEMFEDVLFGAGDVPVVDVVNSAESRILKAFVANQAMFILTIFLVIIAFILTII